MDDRITTDLLKKLLEEDAAGRIKRGDFERFLLNPHWNPEGKPGTVEEAGGYGAVIDYSMPIEKMINLGHFDFDLVDSKFYPQLGAFAVGEKRRGGFFDGWPRNKPAMSNEAVHMFYDLVDFLPGETIKQFNIRAEENGSRITTPRDVLFFAMYNPTVQMDFCVIGTGWKIYTGDDLEISQQAEDYLCYEGRNDCMSLLKLYALQDLRVLTVGMVSRSLLEGKQPVKVLVARN